MTKAAVYTRVSSEEQAQPDKGSLSQQREKCEAYAKAHDWEVAEVYEDAGVSGTKEHRPALDRLLADAHDGVFQVVIFLKVDRFARNVRNLVNLEHDLGELGISIASVEDGFDTSTPSGRLHFNVLGSIAEFEREQILGRMTAGKVGSAKQGRYNSGRPPYGWDYDKETRRLVINEAEAAVVRRIYQMYVGEGLSQAAIARLLNAQGIATKTDYRSPRGDGVKKGWLATHLERILTSSMYRGEHYYNTSAKNGGSKGPKRVPRPEKEWILIHCPPIIDEQTWNAARRRARRNKKRSELCPSGKDKVSEYLLSGLMRCHCGMKMHGTSNTKRRMRGKVVHRYLHCANQNRFPDKYDCRQPRRILAEPVERAVLDALVDAFRDPSCVMRLVDAHTKLQQQSLATRGGMIAENRAKLEEAERQRNRVARLHIDGSISEAHAKRELAIINKDAEVWQEELTRLEEAARQRKAGEEIEKAAWAIASDIREDMAEATVQEKKALIRALVERVWIDGENNVSVECVIPDLTSDSARVPANQTSSK